MTFRHVPRPGENIRRAGTDVRVGSTLFEPGRPLTAGDLALFAAQGRLSVVVHRAPRVAIVSSGNELLELDAGEPGRGQIANTNAWAMAAAVRAAGGVPWILPIVRDDREATLEALTQSSAGADMLLTSGGVSVGEHDHIGPALKALCGDAFAFWKVALKPGKPLIFGRIGACTAFGLPGNPISALVTFEVFVRPALLRHAGPRSRASGGPWRGEPSGRWRRAGRAPSTCGRPCGSTRTARCGSTPVGARAAVPCRAWPGPMRSSCGTPAARPLRRGSESRCCSSARMNPGFGFRSQFPVIRALNFSLTAGSSLVCASWHSCWCAMA